MLKLENKTGGLMIGHFNPFPYIPVYHPDPPEGKPPGCKFDHPWYDKYGKITNVGRERICIKTGLGVVSTEAEALMNWVIDIRDGRKIKKLLKIAEKLERKARAHIRVLSVIEPLPKTIDYSPLDRHYKRS
jgi:hypothetical protein